MALIVPVQIMTVPHHNVGLNSDQNYNLKEVCIFLPNIGTIKAANYWRPTHGTDPSVSSANCSQYVGGQLASSIIMVFEWHMKTARAKWVAKKSDLIPSAR